MHLLRSLSFFVAHFDIYLTATHLPGVINVTADHLSWRNLQQAFETTPSLTAEPTLIPPSALQLILPHRLDWISPHFLQLFQQTLSNSHVNHVTYTPYIVHVILCDHAINTAVLNNIIITVLINIIIITNFLYILYLQTCHRLL